MLAKHDNAESSIRIETHNKRCDECRCAISSFSQGNVLNRLKRRRPPRLEIPKIQIDNFCGEVHNQLMNPRNLELTRLFYRLFQKFWICFAFFRAGKTYSKLKMALTAAVQAASSSPLGASSRFSPNSVRRQSFEDLSVEICSHALASPLNSASPSRRLTTLSHRSPVQNQINSCHGFSQRNDKRLATHDNAKASVIIQGEKQKPDDYKRGISSGFVYASKRPTSPLKRRRPPRLEIPQSSTPVAPSLQELHKDVYVQGRNYSVACKKGRRQVMEDAYSAMTDISGDSRQAFFGVFDGHGGGNAADFAAERLGKNIVDASTQLGEGDGHMEQAVRTGYLTTDEAFSKQKLSSGVCCVTALIRGGHMVVANAGDCRAVLSRDGNAEALTCDHRAEREEERQRIQDLGGYVDCRNGVWRVQGVLAVSRSIGDIHMKEWISAEPDVKMLDISSNCDFLILASDGLWDKVSNQEAVDVAGPFCLEKENKSRSFCERSMDACRKLVEVTVRRGSKDDVTAMIVDLTHFRT